MKVWSASYGVLRTVEEVNQAWTVALQSYCTDTENHYSTEYGVGCMMDHTKISPCSSTSTIKQ